ncbi:MAG: AAA family ATPase [Paludibacteraceae bacterium]|nr:AAA family ATPase [Paludibacteraceae bacterium]
MQRPVIQQIRERINEPRHFIQVLYGPRQVGKTTLITQILEHSSMPHLFVTAEEQVGVDRVWLRGIWSRARQMQREVASDFLLVIDEVQKIANWSETVKLEWDTDTYQHLPIKVVLLGSSSILIQKGLSESLAGRFETIYISHWSYAEMKEAFGWSLNQYLWFGGYPGTGDLIKDEQRWQHYVTQSLIDTTLTKDVLMLTRVDKPALLRRLFTIGCAYSAQIVALNKIQGELQERGNLTTLSNYLSLLSSAGLLCGLEKYAGNVLHQRASKPKFQVYNNALMNVQRAMSIDIAEQDHALWGRVVESAVGVHLLNASVMGGYRVYYWNENSKEVDFVLVRGDKVVALEVKSGTDSINNGMSAFDKLYHPQAIYIIGTDGIPLQDFFLMNPSDLF